MFAATFTVNSPLDTADATPGDGICADALTNCTLRAAIDEANFDNTADTIGFSAAHSIVTTGLQITNPVTIDGTTAPGYAGIPLVRVIGGFGTLNTFEVAGASSIIDALIVTGPAEFHVYFSAAGQLKRSYIGVATGDLAEMGATKAGVYAAASTVNITDCVISGNVGDGIVIKAFTVINGCIIGLRSDGSTPSANLNGIYVGGTAWIGDTSRNVISSNAFDGISAPVGTPDLGANGPWIKGNYIGTDSTGLLDRGNGRHGVHMNPDHTLLEGNVISGNGEHGVLSDLPTRHILAFIEGNIIGLGSDGSTVIPNGIDGIHLTGNNLIIGGTPAATKRNIISGNTRAGIYIESGSVAHSISNNYIGTDSTGTLDRGNTQEGIYSAGRVLIGGNVVSGNGGLAGIAILDPGWASLANNIIGLDAAGASVLPNDGDGVVITSNDSFGVRVGGDYDGARNVISGNFGSGVTVSGQNVQVSSSYIGTDITGLISRPNGAYGVQLTTGASNVTVGGLTAFTRNVIAGNPLDGVRLSSVASNFVQGNYIGTDMSGFAALGNGGNGVLIDGAAASNNVIGGSVPGAGNVIAGNSGSGISLIATNTSGVSIEGNIIGPGYDGLVPLGNAGAGIAFSDGAGSANNNIGGSGAGAGNLIADNATGGIVLSSIPGTTITGNTVRNNPVGITLSTSSNSVSGNTITTNTGWGVGVDPAATGNRITENSIYSNIGLGIDLLPLAGVTPNDSGDPDTGGNTLQNFPVLSGAYFYPGPAGRATGTLNSTPTTLFTLEFFGVASGDPEGRYYLGSTMVMTDGSGNAPFDATLATPPTPGQAMTVTATNSTENTSEFSAELAVTEPGVLSFDSATYSVDETGPSVTLTVNRTGGSDGTVTAVATPSGGSAETTDYDGTAQVVTFGPGVVTQTLTIAITNDTIDESDQTFNINLGSFTGGAIAGTPATAIVTITDNDPTPTISIDDPSASEAAASVPFTLTLSNASESDVTVTFATSDGTATAGSDYSSATSTATILAGDLTTTVLVSILSDTTFETDETLNLTLSSPNNATIADGSGTGTITNEDPEPSASIDDPTVTETDAGTVTMTFTVTLSNPSAGTFTADYATDGGSATPGADYTAASGTLTFDPGMVSRSFDVTVLADEIDEGDEYIVINLTNTTVTDGSGTGTIVDDDAAPSITINDVGVGEGDIGATPLTFTITLSNPSAFPVSVDYATGGGTATAGADYTAESSSVIFAPGETTKPIDIDVLGDDVTEPNETFNVTLSNPSNATILDGTGTGTITDDETAPAISIANTSASEVAGNLTFTVTLSNASSQNVSVDYSTASGTAISGSDFTAAAGTLTINAGLQSGTILVPILADTTFESDETMSVTLTNPSSATIAAGAATGTILNDDPQPSISVGASSASESAANVVFTVTLSNPSSETVNVHFMTTSGTAISNTDFTAINSVLSINPGQLTGTFSVAIIADTIYEPDETFTVTLFNSTNGTISGPTATGTITNDDPLPVIAIDDPMASENQPNVVFTLTLSNASTETVTVNWATSDGTATAGSDYTSSGGTVTFAAGQTAQTVNVPILPDSTAEGNETVNVNLSGAGNGTIGDPTGTGTIFDNESAPTITIEDASANEGDGSLTLVVTLSNATILPVTVDWSTGVGNASAGTDYTPSNGTLTFNPGVLSQTIVIPLVSDPAHESNEFFIVNLSNATNAVLVDSQATATIISDDPPPTIVITDASVSENGSLLLTVTLSHPSELEVTVDWAPTGGTATPATDYLVFGGTLTFSPGVTEVVLPMQPLDDAADEPDETVIITLSNAVNGTLSDAEATITILDNDAAASTADIPTLSEWMLLLMAALLALAAARAVRFD